MKACLEEAGRVGGEKAEGRESDGVESAAIAPDQAAEQVERDHPERALHWLAEAGEDGVGEGGGDSEQRGPETGQVDAAGEPEDDSGEDGEMQAGDDEEVEGAGAFKANAGAALEPGAVAGDHGGEHGGVFGGEAEKCWEPVRGIWIGIGEGHDSFAGGLLQGFQLAGQSHVLRSWENGRCRCLGTGDCADSLLEQVGGRVPDAGIVVAFGRMDRGRDAEGVSALKAGEGFGFGGVEGEADSAADLVWRDAGIGDGLHSQVEGLRSLFHGMGTEWRGRVGDADGSGVDDFAFEDVGSSRDVGEQGGLRVGVGVDLGAEESGGDPREAEGREGYAESPTAGDSGQDRRKANNQERQRRLLVEVVVEENAGGEADGREQRWRDLEAQWFDCGSALFFVHDGASQ